MKIKKVSRTLGKRWCHLNQWRQ